MWEGCELDYAVAEDFCPADEAGSARVELEREGYEGGEAGAMLAEEAFERAEEGYESVGVAGERWV